MTASLQERVITFTKQSTLTGGRQQSLGSLRVENLNVLISPVLCVTSDIRSLDLPDNFISTIYIGLNKSNLFFTILTTEVNSRWRQTVWQQSRLTFS